MKYAHLTLHGVSILGRRSPAPAEALIGLVQTLDSVLDAFDCEPRFAAFTLEGGPALLETYLSLRPEHFERVEMAVRQGRLLLSPLYAIPARFDSEPELLVRNLLIGVRTSRAFGGVMTACLLPETQALPPFMPQILKGFGIECLILPAAPDMPLEARWQGDDGSHVLIGRALSIDPALWPDWRAQWADRSRAGHALIVTPYTANGWELLFAGMRQARIHTRDDVFHSNPVAYARAVEAYARRADLPLCAPACSPLGDSAFQALATILCACAEPASVLSHYGAGASGTALARPGTLLRRLWSDLLRAMSADSPGLLTASTLPAIQTYLPAFGVSAPPESRLAEVAQVSDPAFALTTAKLSESGEGLILRGWNRAAAPVWVEITPFRRFASAHVVTLDEAPTGGVMGLNQAGAIRFLAAPQRLLTFHFKD